MNLRQYARGKPCMVRVGGVCNHDPATTVLAHLGGGGMAMKRNDLHGAWCCRACHDVIDGRDHWHNVTIPEEYKRDVLLGYLMDGIIRTQEELLAAGLGEVIEKWARGLKL